ncbi:MAG: NAD(P)/FAD-dependent oxidoreductase [Chloroflexi bacterium]|nr:NAD(P)/FAD-dependent oxidoreductase [Chloroflexota bacterium]
MTPSTIGSRTFDARLGTAAGLLAGLVAAGLLAGQGRLDTSQPLRLDPPTVGWLAFLSFAVAGGAAYGALYRFQPGRFAATVGGGLMFGLLWWAAIWLTTVPIVIGTGPRWSIEEASNAFPLLITSVLAGGATAIAFHVAGARLIGDRAATRLVASASLPVRERIVVLGGGFGGVATAQRLEELLSHRPDIGVTLISEGNSLLFTPMLAEVASGSLVPRHVAAPLRATCPRTTIRRAKVESVDVAARSVRILASADAEPESVAYDRLVVAVGAVPAFHNLPGVAEQAFTLKSLADAMDLRDHVIGLLDRAESEPDPDVRRRRLTFVVAGGGFAGSELIAELHDFVLGVLVYHPRIERDEPRFVLIHSRDRILPELSAELGAYALERLRARGIEFRLGVRVAGATRDAVSLSDGSAIPTETFVWTAGNEPAPVVGTLLSGADRAGLETDDTLRATGLADVWAAGDCARIPDPDRAGQLCPPTAQHALRQGRLAAENVVAAIDGRPPRPFRFRTLGMLVVLGHNTAAAEIRGWRFSGLLAWLMWRGIYLAKLPGFEKKVRVAIDWLLDLVFPRDIVVASTAGPREAVPGRVREAGR